MKNKTFIIAEIAQAHDGSLGILHSYIDSIAKTDVDAIKFQTHIAEAESSINEPFRKNFSYVDKTRFDYWKRMSFSLKEWKEIKAHCEDCGIEFMSSPFSIAAVDLLEEIGITRYKIGSGEVTNLLMLKKICKTGKPIILSSGMSDYEELDSSVNYIKKFGNDLSILQCTTSYPTPAEKLGLNVIQELISRYPNCVIGFSDHSSNPNTCVSAVTLGARIIEFHATFDRKMFGPDSSSSLTINEINDLVNGIRYLEKAFENPVDKFSNNEFKELKNIFEKTLAVNKDLKKGHIITFEDLESKKPSNMGISAKEFENVIGKKLIRNKSKFDFLTSRDIN